MCHKYRKPTSFHLTGLSSNLLFFSFCVKMEAILTNSVWENWQNCDLKNKK